MNDAEFYDNLYRNEPNKWANNTLRPLIAFYALSCFIKEPRSILDVGCGNGFILEFLGKPWRDSILYGVDLSEYALELAQKRVPNGIFVQHDFLKQELPLFDIALCMGVAEHFIDLNAGLKRLGEVGRIIYLEVPNCLAYSDEDYEGYRKTNEGAEQLEWHLKRETWEKSIRRAGLYILDKYTGPYANFQFIWVLKCE